MRWLIWSSGAGKTTTFSMLTGDINATRGTAIISGFDIRTDLRKVMDTHYQKQNKTATYNYLYFTKNTTKINHKLKIPKILTDLRKVVKNKSHHQWKQKSIAEKAHLKLLTSPKDATKIYRFVRKRSVKFYPLAVKFMSGNSKILTRRFSRGSATVHSLTLSLREWRRGNCWQCLPDWGGYRRLSSRTPWRPRSLDWTLSNTPANCAASTGRSSFSPQ